VGVDGFTFGGGVLKSLDGGRTWSDASSGLIDPRISALAIDPQKSNTLYVSTAGGASYGGGLYRSEDGGANWQRTNNLSAFPAFSGLLVDPHDSRILYGYNRSVILKSIDGGKNWTWLESAFFGNLTSLVLDPNDSRVIYATTWTGVHRSTNGGAHWSPFNEGLTDRSVSALLIDVQDHHTLYAGTTGGGMFGITLSQEPPSSLTLVAPNGGEKWQAGSAHTILWTSTGNTWDVKIEVSLDDGVTYSTITSATADTGLYYWTAPNTVATNARIRVSATGGQVSDASDGSFAIVAPTTSIRIESPSPDSVLTGSVTVKAAVSGDEIVQQVVFRVDGSSLGQSTAAPFTAQWETSDAWDGFHQLQAIALDSSGFTLAETHIRVAVSGSKVAYPGIWILPSSARAGGVGGSFYTTDITVANAGIVDASFTLKFLGHDVDGTAGSEKLFALGAGKSVMFNDVLQSVFGLASGYGAIRMTSTNSDLALMSQTSTPGAGGTFGQSVPSIREFISPGVVGSISGIREDLAFRTNLILTNITTTTFEVEVTLLDPDGKTLGTGRYTLPPLGMKQISRIARDLGVTTNIAGASLSVFPASEYGAFAAYASVIDNVTNDPRTLLPR